MKIKQSNLFWVNLCFLYPSLPFPFKKKLSHRLKVTKKKKSFVTLTPGLERNAHGLPAAPVPVSFAG